MKIKLLFLMFVFFISCSTESKNKFKKSKIENYDTISIVYYGNLKNKVIDKQIINLYKKTSFIKFNIGGVIDSTSEDKKIRKLKKFLFSLKPQQLLNQYWDSTSNGLVRRIYFINSGFIKEVRIIGYPKGLPNDSLIIVSDKLLKIICNDKNDNCSAS